MSTDKEDIYNEYLKSLETKNGDNWTIQLEKFLDNGGEVRICKTCNGPSFGHIDTHCREVKS